MVGTNEVFYIVNNNSFQNKKKIKTHIFHKYFYYLYLIKDKKYYILSVLVEYIFVKN